VSLSRTNRHRRPYAGRKVANRRLSNPGMMLKRHTGVAERVRTRAREFRVPMGSAGAAARAMASRLPIAKIALLVCVLAIASIGLLAGVNAFAKSKQLNVRIENGIAPMPVNVITTAQTVRDLLAEQNIRLGPKDEVTPALNTRLADGMVVIINRAIIVYITSNGQMMPPLYITGGTVDSALAKAKISYDQDDDITPSLDTKLTAGIRISHIVVEKKVVTEYQSIEYSTYYQNTSSLPKGKTVVSQPGKRGKSSRQIEVTYRDGVEVKRTELSHMNVEDPQPRKILKGTGSTEPKATTSPSSGGNSGGYGGHYGHVKPEDLIVPAVPSKFETILYMTITAYTHTGRTTAKGNWPQYTRTLKKPGTIAIDPKAIPYGTLLYVTGYGYCVAEDTGSNTVDSSRMGDVFMNTKEECYKWGRRRNVTVYVVQYDYKTKWSKSDP
jgi:uncharacterized protein YabE (DUF348 family)/3D (Asp-Asp-Asp) domain-containing protein